MGYPSWFFGIQINQKWAWKCQITLSEFNVKWRSETFDEKNVIIVQSVVVLNMNTEVFRIHDMNTLYKLCDLKHGVKYFM